jgi:hypothetical protein
MSCLLNLVHLDICEVVGQAVGSLGLHPVTVTIKKIHRNLGFGSFKNHLDAADGLDWPLEELVESPLTAFFLLDDVLHVFPPYLKLILGHFESVLKGSIDELVSDPEGVHNLSWPQR